MIIAAVSTEAVRNKAAFCRALNAVSAERRARVLSFAKEEDRQRSLCAGLALDACLQTVGLREAQVPLLHTASGKPQLAEKTPWQVNVSHSGQWAVCAMDTAAVGIDVEQIRPVRCLPLARRWFSAAETAWLEAQSPTNRPAAFFRLWAAKESVLKAQGVGLQHLSRTTVLENGRLVPPPPWRLREYALAGYCLTVCGTGNFPTAVSFFSSCNSVLLR